MSESELPKVDVDPTNEVEITTDGVVHENVEGDESSPAGGGIEIVIGEQIPGNATTGIELVDLTPPLEENATGSSIAVHTDETVAKSSEGLVLLDLEVGDAIPTDGPEGDSENVVADEVAIEGTENVLTDGVDGEAGEKVDDEGAPEKFQGEGEDNVSVVPGEEGEKVEGEGEIPVDGAESKKEGEEIKVEGDGEKVEGDEVVEQVEAVEGGESASTTKEEKLEDPAQAHVDKSEDDAPAEPGELETLTIKAATSNSDDDFMLDVPSVTSLVSNYSYDDELGSGERSPELQIDRDFWCDMYRNLLEERTVLQRKNNILQKKLLEHYKKRKLENIFKSDIAVTPEMEAKYTKKLATYNEMRNVEETDRLILEAELRDLSEEEEKLTEDLQEGLADLISLERETGIGLINTKTGKVIPDKIVERFLKRQESKVYEVGQYRLAYIKIRDKVNLKDAAMKGLENIGENLHMIDYEQLRMENQNLCDKIEERDDELTRLRERTTQSIQILAHFKEKSFAILKDIDVKADDLRSMEDELEAVRGSVNNLKHTRDKLRADFIRENEEAGLLTKPKLLRDFEEAIKVSAKMSEELENIKNTCNDEQHQLAEIRRSIERGAALEFKPRISFMEKLDKKRAKRKAWRELNSKSEKSITGDDDDESEYIFQM